MTEFAHVEDGSPDSITCVCGNTCADEGMIQCNSEGIAFHLYGGDTPAGLAEMPEDRSQLYMLCPSCGRIYRDQTITETNTARVVGTVDTESGPAAESIKIYWDLGNS